VPGRSWWPGALAAITAGAVALVTAVTVASWQASPVTLGRGWLAVGAICFAASALTALPATIVTSMLALAALPTRPAVTGLLAGLGGGVMADAGWRLFCHFSDPPPVFATHLGGVVRAALVGAGLTAALAARRAVRARPH
jgi:hypothetical protein